MKASTLILAELLISALLLSGCMSRAQSFRMLDRRAEYEDLDQPRSGSDPNLKEAGLDGFTGGPIPVRSRPKVAAIWIHPHEMATHDYFWGGWMSVVVEADQWVLSQPGGMPAAPGISDVTGVHLKSPPARIPGARPKLKIKRPVVQTLGPVPTADVPGGQL